MPISIAGLASGVDTNAIIDDLMDLARAPIRSYESQISDLTFRKSKLQDLNTLLTTLKTSVDAVNSATDLPAFTATSTQPTSVGVTASSSATPGSHDVTVVETAETAIQHSNSFTLSTDTLAEGTLTITYGTTATVVPISSTDDTLTIDGIASYINTEVLGVQAYVLDTGQATDPYQLIVEGEDTGAANTLSMAVSQTGLGESLSFSTLQAPQDAHLIVDTIDVYRPTNTPGDVLPGVTFDIRGVTTGASTVVVSQDSSTMISNIDAVVTAYNALIDYFADNSGPNADARIAGDQTLRTVQRRLQTIMSAGYDTSEVAGLNSIGLGTDQYGKIQFTSSEFSTLVGTNFDDVMEMLTGTGGLFGDLYTEADSLIDPVTGIIQPRVDSIDDQVVAINDKIEDAEYRLDLYQSTLQAQFTQMEILMSQYQATSEFLTQQIKTGFGMRKAT